MDHGMQFVRVLPIGYDVARRKSVGGREGRPINKSFSSLHIESSDIYKKKKKRRWVAIVALIFLAIFNLSSIVISVAYASSASSDSPSEEKVLKQITNLTRCDMSTSTCVINVGSYECECVCLSGYTKDGDACVDIDECASTTTCDNSTSACENRNGSFECVCFDGYFGTNNTCSDINECESMIKYCHNDGGCVNEIASYHCECLYGYSGDHCDVCPRDTCCSVGNGHTYVGTRNTTRSGLHCVRWDVHAIYDAFLFPDADISDAANYCRKPTYAKKKPFCHTKAGSAARENWEYCALHECDST